MARWTDTDIEVLLCSTNEYRVAKLAHAVDWESVKDKYGEILALCKKNSPESFDESFTKERLGTKLKTIRCDYRKAVDAGRKSGGGRVVCTFYDLCQEIWAGSPATESMQGGLESGEADGDDDDEEYVPENSDQEHTLTLPGIQSILDDDGIIGGEEGASASTDEISSVATTRAGTIYIYILWLIYWS